MRSQRLFSAVSVFAVLVATFAFGLTLVPAPAQALDFCILATAACPGSQCVSFGYECNCTSPGGKPRLEQIMYCQDDPSIILARTCTNDKC